MIIIRKKIKLKLSSQNYNILNMKNKEHSDNEQLVKDFYML